MLPRYIFHIGPWKTASTYLQQCLMTARPALKEQGILYPEEFCTETSRFRHKGLYGAISSGQAEKTRPVFKQLNEQGYKTIVISCEDFILLSQDSMQTLRDATGAEDFQVVYAARRWSDRIGSLWNQNMMMGGEQNLPEFYLSLLAGEPPSHYPRRLADQIVAGDLDYSVNFRLVENVFGREALGIFPYSAIADRKEDVFDVFCHQVLGLAEVPPSKFAGQRRWASLPIEDQEMVRVLNSMHLRAGRRQNARAGQNFIHLRGQMDTTAIAAALAQDITTLFIDDNSVLFDAPFANMEKYADRVIGGGEIFERRGKKVKYVKPGYLLEPGVQAAFQAMHDRIAKAGPQHDTPEDAEAPVEAATPKAAPRRRGRTRKAA
jgi:hypothetical protein